MHTPVVFNNVLLEGVKCFTGSFLFIKNLVLYIKDNLMTMSARLLITSLFLTYFLLNIKGLQAQNQSGDDGKLVVKKRVGTVISPKLEKLRSRQDYMDDKKSFMFKVYLVDSCVVEANFDIFYDKTYYIFYLEADSLKKIYPEQTLLLSKRVNTEDEFRHYLGIPTQACWRFCVMKGRMNGVSFYLRSNAAINEIQVDDTDFLSINSLEAEAYFKTSPKAYEYYLAKDYRKAIKAWNAGN